MGLIADKDLCNQTARYRRNPAKCYDFDTRVRFRNYILSCTCVHVHVFHQSVYVVDIIQIDSGTCVFRLLPSWGS